MGFQAFVLDATLLIMLPALTQASLYNESTFNHTCVLGMSLVPFMVLGWTNMYWSSKTRQFSHVRQEQVSEPLTLAVRKRLEVCSLAHNTGPPVYLQLRGMANNARDTYTGLEAQGQKLPAQQWTLHGLWPDFCNGSYTQYCDLTRQYDPSPSPNTTNGFANGTTIPPYAGPNIGTFLQPFGKLDLLAYMEKYWINQGAPNSNFWGHEFSKHATCYSTFDVPCYGPEYVEHEDVVDFFQTAIMYYQRFPTYNWLAEAGITPSNSTTYTLSNLQTALASKHGAIPYIGCSGARYNTTSAGSTSGDDGRTVVDEVWYYMHVSGRPQDGNAVPVNATLPVTSCAQAEGALKYYLRTPSSLQ